MNPPTQPGASPQFIAFAKRQVQSMHALIDAKQIPAEKTDDFFLQTANLEHALGDHAYTQLRQRHRAAKRGPAIIASVILLAALIIYGIGIFGPAGSPIAQATNRLMADSALLAGVIGALAALLLIGVIAARLYARSLGTTLLGKDLSALWARVLQRWAPALAATHDFAHIDPASIAQLVAVQIRIEDVDLNLQ